MKSRPKDFAQLLGARGFGHLFQPVYKDKKTGERKTSALWWLKWGHGGKVFKESTKTSDHARAEDYRKNKFKEIWDGRMPWQPRKEPTLGELLERKLTRAKTKGRASLRTMAWNVRALTDATGIDARTLARDVTEVRIEALVQAKRDGGMLPASVNRLLAFLRSAFRIAYKTLDSHGSRLVLRVPEIEMLEEANVRQTMPSQADYEAIRLELAKVKRHVPGCLPRLFDFYRVTGYRRSEPLKLTWDRVDRQAGLIQLPKYDTKSKQWRAAWPYTKHPVLRAAIDGQLEAKRETEVSRGVIVSHVFFRPCGKPIRSFRKAWDKARCAIGRPDLWVHDFRRAAYRDLIKAGTDAKTARKMIGAKSASIGDRYHVVVEQDTVEAAVRLAEYHAETAGATEQLVIAFGKGAG